jgi:hypothetical protein
MEVQLISTVDYIWLNLNYKTEKYCFVYSYTNIHIPDDGIDFKYIIDIPL